MSKSPICYLSPTGGIDDRIANHLNNGLTKDDIGALRGLYEEDYGEPLLDPLVSDRDITDTDMMNAADKIMQYKSSITKRHLDEMRDTTKHMAKAFSQLYQVNGWNRATRRNRINMIVADFSAEVSRRQRAAQRAGNTLSRENIINGRKVNGQYYDGQFDVFESIFNRYLKEFRDALEVINDINELTPEELAEYRSTLTPEEALADVQLEEDSRHIIEEYAKILNNWAALCTFARMTLRDTEGLKLGQTLEYAAPTNEDNFSIDSILEDDYDPEAAVPEAWQVLRAAISAFSSLGTEVRRFLSTIKDVDDNGEEIKDDLGYVIRMDPIEMHTYLLEVLRGVTSESNMIKKLKSLGEEDPKVKAVFGALANAAKADLSIDISDENRPENPAIITQLLLDMHKNFIPYTSLIEIVKDGIKKVVVKVLNKKDNPLRSEFTLRMALHEPISFDSIYDEEGLMDWEKYATWYSESLSMLPAPSEEEKESGSAFDKLKNYGGEAPGFWNKQMSPSMRKEYLIRAAKAIGIPMDGAAATKIYSNPELVKKLLNAFQNFRTETYRANVSSRDDEIKKAFLTIAKYSGLRPSVSQGFTAEQRQEYDEALDVLKSVKKTDKSVNRLSYEEFINETYGKLTEGPGLENINKMLDVLADATDNQKLERRVPWYDRKGKSTPRFSDRTPSYMGDLIDKLREFVATRDRNGLRRFVEDKWGQSSFFCYDRTKDNYKFYNRWLQELYDSITIDAKGFTDVRQDAFAKIFQFDEFLGSNISSTVTIFENFTEKQHAEAMLKQYVQLSEQSKRNKSLAKYPCFILGDSGVQMFFTAKKYSKEDILQGLRDVFKQEKEHQKTVEALNKVLSEGGYKTVANYDQTADEFTTLTFLNPTFKDGKYWKILTAEEDIPADRHKAMEMAIDAADTDALDKALQAYMDDAVVEFKDKLIDVGILEKGKGEDGVIKYYDPNNFLNYNLRNYNNSIDAFIEDFFWNTKYATIEQLQMFTVDPAFYDHNYPVKDLQKRYKEIYAPGKGISTEARNIVTGELATTRDYETVVYFDDIKINSEEVNKDLMDMLKSIFKDRPDIIRKYSKNTLTDGQGYRTLDSYRAVKTMAGEWSQVMEEAYQRIKNVRNSGNPITSGDIAEITQLAANFQPIKPYLYTLEKVMLNEETKDIALIPVQHKYAEIVLIPEIMPEGKLKDMAIWMENHTDEKGMPAPIDMVCSDKCVKVGSFGGVDLSNAASTEEIIDALNKGYVHKLPWADYRIQSGVPEHLNHSQLFGTQIRKLILEGIRKSNVYNNYLSNIFHIDTDDPNGLKVNLPGMGEVYLTGSNLISFYNCLIMSNMFESYDLLSSQLDTNQNLSDRMIQNIIANASQAEDNAYALSIIEDGATGEGEFVIPPAEPGLEHDTSALLFSMFRKEVNKQKILGGSAVQASPLGLSGRSLGIKGKYAQEVGDLFEVVFGNNVLYDEIEMPWNRTFKSATGKVVPLAFEDWCITDDPEHFGELLVCDGKDGRPLKIVHGEKAKEYLSWPVSGRNETGKPAGEVDENGYDKQGYYVPLLEAKFPGMLDIIAYRIPTEKDYSMINAKVFRFSHPLGGGTLKVPSSRTTTAGFDFDIDKLYFFMREFAQTNEVKNKEIWDAIYDQNDAFREFHKKLRAAHNAVRSNTGKSIFGRLSSWFGKSESLAELAETDGDNSKLRDYHFWEMVLQDDESGMFDNIPATPEEAFSKYLADNNIMLFDNYDLKATPTENSRAARNNMLIDLIKQRLMDEETLRSRYTPGGFENNRDAALRMRVLQFAPINKISKNGHIDLTPGGLVDQYIAKIRDVNDPTKDPEPEYDPSDPTAILVYNQQNQIAGKLIGIFANQNTNHVYASTMQKMMLLNPIKFGDHIFDGLSDFLHAPEGVDVGVNVAEYLAASVDAVKDPVLNFLNLNLITADAGAMLARIGYTPQEIGLLFNQPIIKELCNYATNNNVSADIAIHEMLKKYGGDNATFDKFEFDPSTVSSQKLADNIMQERERVANGQNRSRGSLYGQLNVLYLFNEIMADASDVNSFVQCTRFTAANSVGSTWGDFFAQQDRVQNFIDKYAGKNKEDSFTGRKEQTSKNKKRLDFQLYEPEEGDLTNASRNILTLDDELLELSSDEYIARMSRNPFAFEQCMMDLTKKAAKKLFGKHYPYYTSVYSNVRNFMKTLTKYGTLDADTINSIHRELIVYLLSRRIGSAFDGEAMNYTLGKEYAMTNREYYTMQFPVLLEALKSEGVLNSVPFFSMLNISGNEDVKTGRNALKITVNGMGGLQSRTSNNLREMWAEAASSDAKVYSTFVGKEFSISQLAKDFYYYNFYHLGYNFHAKSTMSLAPTSLKLLLDVSNDANDQSYIEFIKRVIKGEFTLDPRHITSFIKQYLLNHLDNKKLVFYPKGQSAKPVLKKAFRDNTWQSSFTISYSELGNDTARLYTVSDKNVKGENMYAFRPVIALEKVVNGQSTIAYYMASAQGDVQFNHSLKGDGKMTYKQVFAQGIKGEHIQYFDQTHFDRFQREHKLDEHKRLSLNEMNERARMAEDMTPSESMEEGTHIQLGDSVSDMFTDKQWSTMIQEFRRMYPSKTQGVHDSRIREMLSDTSHVDNVSTLNELARKLERGELKTIDEKENEIEVCS